MSIIIPALLNAAQIDTATIADNSITDAKIDFGTGTGQVNTDDLPEGSTNLYHTDTRVDDRIAAASVFDLSDVSGSDAFGNVLVGTGSGFMGMAITTDNLTEGSTNLYHTDARAISAVENEATLDLSGTVTVTGNTANKTTTIGDFDALALYDSTGVQIEGDDTSWAGLSFVEYEGGSSKPVPNFPNAFINVETWGGTPSSTTALGSGKRLFAISAGGAYDNGGTIQQPSTSPVRMIIETTETQTSSARGAKMYVQTTPTGSTSRTTTATFQGNDTSLINLFATGEVVFSNLPTTDPANVGQLWNDSGTLKVSAG